MWSYTYLMGFVWVWAFGAKWNNSDDVDSSSQSVLLIIWDVTRISLPRTNHTRPRLLLPPLSCNLTDFSTTASTKPIFFSIHLLIQPLTPLPRFQHNPHCVQPHSFTQSSFPRQLSHRTRLHCVWLFALQCLCVCMCACVHTLSAPKLESCL